MPTIELEEDPAVRRLIEGSLAEESLRRSRRSIKVRVAMAMCRLFPKLLMYVVQCERGRLSFLFFARFLVFLSTDFPLADKTRGP